jgi:diguanylate cyclase (GGDEF)-like protein
VKLRVREVMTTDVAVVARETPLEDVVALMLDQLISCVLVCDKSVPVGVISERDLVRTFAERLADSCVNATAADVMTGPPVSVGQDWSVERAMELIRQRRIRRLPVVDANQDLVGLVTQTDLLGVQRETLACTVRDRTRELQRANERLRELSMKDGLLGIGNRRAMNEALDRAQRVAERYGRPHSVVLADVDHFKAYNDFYGHPEADLVLQEIARSLCETARGADAVFRYGGEEILVLLTETSLEGAFCMAERARAGVEALDIPSDPTPVGRVTVSCGVASSHGADGRRPGSWRDVLSQADASLYHAKRAGRNRVGACPASEPPDATADA